MTGGRSWVRRAVLLACVAVTAVSVGCRKSELKVVDPFRKAKVGEPVRINTVKKVERTCASGPEFEDLEAGRFEIIGPDGAMVEDSVFTAKKPGSYVVVAYYPADAREAFGQCSIEVTGEAIEEEPAGQANPLAGTWRYECRVWEGGPKPYIGTGSAEIAISQDAKGNLHVPKGTVTLEGSKVTVTFPWVTLSGTLDGDTITGTQDYADATVPVFDESQPGNTRDESLNGPWVATRVK